MPGDELRLRHAGDRGKHWSGIGHVVKLPDNYGDEVGIEFKSAGGAPTDYNTNYIVEYVWKSTSFDRYSIAANFEFHTFFDIISFTGCKLHCESLLLMKTLSPVTFITDC